MANEVYIIVGLLCVFAIAVVVNRIIKNTNKNTESIKTAGDGLPGTDIKIMKHAPYFIDKGDIGKITSQRTPENGEDNIIITYVSDIDGKEKTCQYPIKDIITSLTDLRTTNVKIMVHNTPYLETALHLHISEMNEKNEAMSMRVKQYHEFLVMLLSEEGDVTILIEEFVKRLSSIKPSAQKAIFQQMPAPKSPGGMRPM